MKKTVHNRVTEEKGIPIESLQGKGLSVDSNLLQLQANINALDAKISQLDSLFKQFVYKRFSYYLYYRIKKGLRSLFYNGKAWLTFAPDSRPRRLLLHLYISISIYAKNNRLLKKIYLLILARYPNFIEKIRLALTSQNAALRKMVIIHNRTLKKMASTYIMELKQLPQPIQKNLLEQIIAVHNKMLEQIITIHNTELSSKITLQHLTPQAATIYLAIDKSLNKTERIELSNSLARSFPPKPRLKQLFVDVSAIAHNDLKTGIQRIVRSQLLGLFASPPSGFRIEPIYLTHDNNRQWHYRYAYHYMHTLLNTSSTLSFDQPIDFYDGDVLYMPDLACHNVIFAHKAGVFKQLQAAQIPIHVLLYDILPITHPHFFPPQTTPVFTTWLNSVIEFSDQIICISDNTESELRKFMATHHSDVTVPTCFIHSGADIITSHQTTEVDSEMTLILDKISSKKTFLVIGTIEPRKGHAQILKAFSHLWKNGVDVDLVIVGKKGWMVDKLVKEIKQHPEFSKRLFWLKGINDEILNRLYLSCTALIMASEAEGFGLPLIEAAQHHLPLIVRDIPVFKEIAGPHAFYFTGLEANDLALAIREWLDLYSTGAIPTSAHLPWVTWSEHVEQLKKLFVC